MKFYNQVYANLDRGVKPTSRNEVLQGYFQKYFPYIFQNFPEKVQGFIAGDITYEQLCIFIDSARRVRKVENFNRRSLYEKLDIKKYGPRSMAPVPYSLEDDFDVVLYEFDRFRDAFGRQNRSLVQERVPGTYDIQALERDRVRYIMQDRKRMSGR